MKERFTERFDNYIKLNTNSPYADKMAIERLAEYEDLEEQGLIVRLPCIRKCKTCFQVIYEDEYTKQITYIAYGLWKITEAEKKLKELKGEEFKPNTAVATTDGDITKSC